MYEKMYQKKQAIITPDRRSLPSPAFRCLYCAEHRHQHQQHHHHQRSHATHQSGKAMLGHHHRACAGGRCGRQARLQKARWCISACGAVVRHRLLASSSPRIFPPPPIIIIIIIIAVAPPPPPPPARPPFPAGRSRHATTAWEQGPLAEADARVLCRFIEHYYYDEDYYIIIIFSPLHIITYYFPSRLPAYGTRAVRAAKVQKIQREGKV